MKPIQQMTNVLMAVCACLLGLSNLTMAAPRGGKQPIPDFTKDGKPDGSHDWTLVPTGARGWMYAWKHTGDSRQILITEVAKGSPADGVLQKDDVILGVAGKPFADDARIQLARAIMVAEQNASKGVLRIIRWRAGKTETVEIKLPVLGTYSSTAPYDCEKSAKILDLGCKAIAKRGLAQVSIPNSINATTLLASGNKEYEPLLSDYAKKVAELHMDSMATWHYGYALAFLAEYVMATGDRSVMPGVQRLALEAIAEA